MKLFFVLASLLLAFSAQAGDRKIGNVIAVEREITDIYDTCLKAVDGDTSKPKSFFSCGIKYVGAGELPVSKGRVLKLVDERCNVWGDSMNGVILITFAGAGNTSSFETSRACLERATTPNNSVKVVVYTHE